MPQSCARPRALRRLRLNAGLTLSDLARESGVSVVVLRRMETGTCDVLLTIALRVAGSLDAEVEDLFGEDPCR